MMLQLYPSSMSKLSSTVIAGCLDSVSQRQGVCWEVHEAPVRRRCVGG